MNKKKIIAIAGTLIAICLIAAVSIPALGSRNGKNDVEPPVNVSDEKPADTGSGDGDSQNAPIDDRQEEAPPASTEADDPAENAPDDTTGPTEGGSVDEPQSPADAGPVSTEPDNTDNSSEPVEEPGYTDPDENFPEPNTDGQPSGEIFDPYDPDTWPDWMREQSERDKMTDEEREGYENSGIHGY